VALASSSTDNKGLGAVRKERVMKKILMVTLLSFFLWGCNQADVPALESVATGLRATYYDNEDFTGTKVSRVDTTLNFNWQDASPAPGIAPDSFSVRWTGSITPRYSELYTFIVNADDGVRLWVNGVKLIDSWTYTSDTRYAKLRLEANKAYAIRLDYHDGVSWAGLKLQWQSRSQKREVVSAFSTTSGLSAGLSADAPLRDLAYARGIAIGGALQPGPLANETIYQDIAKREFNFLSPEYSFLVPSTQLDADPFNLRQDLTELDAQINFARQNGAQVQAFHLIWYLDSVWSPWLNDVPVDQRWYLIQERIRQLMTRYKGKVRSYNVVNEAFDEQGKMREGPFEFNGSPENNWLSDLGGGYIEYSFREARKIDPGARLFYNDYGLETDGPKWNAVLNMVKDFKARGVPIDGVGFQAHLGLQYGVPDPAILASHFRELQKLGVEVRITEFDLGIANAAGTEQERLNKQAAYYKAFLNVCLAAPNCTAFHMWGFTDKHSWVTSPDWGQSPANKPLIFDANYQKKPAYYGLRDALLGR
jgi:endo-1,4-beta-xylanase